MVVLSCDDIEKSKENVQPVAKGRSASSLNNCASSVAARHASSHPRAMQFEQELRDYVGPDPLQTWLRYIKWTEEEFVSGGDRSHLTVLLERCSMTFMDDPRYRDSKKYLKVWITFAHNCHAGVEDLFQFLQTKSIGQTHALFYQAWACVLESKQDFEAAESILEVGINANAKPLEKLTQSLNLLKLRRKSSQQASTQSAVAANSRTALVQLSKKKAGSSHRQGVQPQPLVSRSSVPQQNSTIEVFIEEESSNRRPPRHTIETTGPTSFSHRAMNKENVQAPTTWTEPLQQFHSRKPADVRTSSIQPTQIKVFVEENLQQCETSSRNQEFNLRKRLHGVPVSERLRDDPLSRIHCPPQSQAHFSAEIVDYERSYDAIMLNDPETPEGLSFEEVRAREYFRRAAEVQDDMPMTVNYSQILSVKGAGLQTPKISIQSPIMESHPRRLQFSSGAMTPGANVVDVPSIQNFLAQPKKTSLVVPRSALPPPSPTVTMTVDTRNALKEVRSMFADNGHKTLEDSDFQQNSNETTEFEVFHDPTVDLRASSKIQEIQGLPSGVVVDPLTITERCRIAGAPGQVRSVVDHSSVAAPDEIQDIEEDCTIEVDDADLLVLSRITENVFEAQDFGTDKTLILKIVRPASIWESYIAEKITERGVGTSADSLILANRSYIFEDLSVVVSDLRDDLGTVQKLIDKFKTRGSLCPEVIGLLYTQQILTILHILNNTNILHCKIQPKHLVLGSECHTLALIDFSSAVDMQAYCPQTRFSSPVVQCTHPTWRNEIDSFGAASTIHQILFGTDLDLTLNVQQMLQKIEEMLPESYAFDIWAAIFQSLLTEDLPSAALHHLIEMHWEEIGTDALKFALCDTNVLINEQ